MTLVWEAARDEARRLRAELGTADPFRLCELLGIEVVESPMPDDVSGMIVREAGGDPWIFIDSTDVAGRRRFTCAHELGHFVERTNIAGDDDFSFRDHRRSSVNDLHEFFANEFAGELLMPADEVSLLLRDGASVTTIASRYRVTPAAVERRIERLRKNPPRAA